MDHRMGHRSGHHTGRHPGPAPSAPVILGNDPGSFAWSVQHERHPALIERVRRGTPYPPAVHRALDALLAEIGEGGVMRGLGDGEADAATWWSWGASEHVGRRWADAPFLWAESYFYRRLLGALGYFGTGPWRAVDPFAPFKSAELRGAGVDSELASLDQASRSPGTRDERDAALLQSSLWGNRADLGFRISAGDGGVGERVHRLVHDDSAAFWDVLDRATAPGTVCLVADNAGPELLPDLVLADHLLGTGRASAVVLHVKPHPYYVSDATTDDVLACLRRLTEAEGGAAETGHRLGEFIARGTVILRAHPFSCAPLPYADMPDDLREDFASASVTVMKGDLNYRRLVGDRLWPPTTPFAEATGYFPGPVAALRTLKSDVITGLSGERVAELDAEGEGGGGWRTSGRYGLIQVSA
ncbi:damage-control phosphatase ARMT1 family protein [Streptomyces sp. NPDC058001]|uniref:damage-control phosphatase ARMT1 family protein n=1 Tax=Streptomyces sp. NPDC058001 TaxID=3346300 RepID=UPI0036E6ADA5